MTITPEVLAELKRLEAAATKGEWKAEYDQRSSDHYLKVELPCINGLSAWFQIGKVRSPDYAEMQMTDDAFSHGENNAAFIVAACNHLREMTDEIEICNEMIATNAHEIASLRTQLADVRAEIERLKKDVTMLRNTIEMEQAR